MSVQNRKEFDKLKEIWYAKLRESGFNDIEDKSNTSCRKNKIYGRPDSRTPFQLEIIGHYYSMASSFVHDHNFDDELDKTIWIYHSEGLSVREISDVLIKAGVKYKKSSVHNIIQKLEDLMKKKYLSP